MALITYGNRPNGNAPCKIFDANGIELTYVTACDPDTGFVEQYVMDDHGRPVVDEGKIERKTTIFPAPLSVVSEALDG